MVDENQHKLIESLYDVTTNSDKYDEMLHLWESEFLQIPDDLNIGDGDEPESTKQIANMFESHFYRAFAILDMVSLNHENTPTVKQLTEADPLPVLILSASGKILMSSEAAGVQLNLMNGQQMGDIAFVDDGAQKLEQCLSELEFAPADKVIDIVKISHISNDMPVLMAMSKIYDEDGAQNFIRLAAVHMMWDDKVGENIQDMFGLSDAELYIAKHLVAGERLSDIAHARGRSVATVRTQIKSLYKKVNLNTQSELIKLFSLLQSFDYKSDHEILEYLDKPRTTSVAVKQDNYLVRADGRKVYYEIYGNPEGRPVLFLHGVISGTKFSQNILTCLRGQEIKLICPHRSGFGYSDVQPSKDKLKYFVEDIDALLDQENINKCSVIGHQGGAYYAFILAQEMTARITNIRVISGGVPHKNVSQINEMKMRQRIMAYMGLYTPKLLPYFLRAAIA